MQILASYGVAFLVLGVLDGLWLMFVARDFYQREIGPLLLAEVRKLPALLFYLGYPMGLVRRGGYDTPGYARGVAVADTAWGAVVSAAAGAAVWWVSKRWV